MAKVSVFRPSALALAVLCVSFAAAAEESDGKTSGDYRYTIRPDGTAEIVAYLGTEGNVAVPSRLGGHAVTSIGATSFSGCPGILSVLPGHYQIESSGSSAEPVNGFEELGISRILQDAEACNLTQG